jgi:hypothetical protein
MDQTADLQYPDLPRQGADVLVGGLDRHQPPCPPAPREFPSGFVNCLYERVRSGVIHMGFGTIISSMAERQAARAGHLVGHWHLHLYFPTYTLEREGDNETLIENGRLGALDDPAIRKLCAKYGDVDLWLDELEPRRAGSEHGRRILGPLRPRPAALGQDRARGLPQLPPDVHGHDGADDKYCHGAGAEWWKGGCCNHSGVRPPRSPAIAAARERARLKRQDPSPARDTPKAPGRRLANVGASHRWQTTRPSQSAQLGRSSAARPGPAQHRI